jgi:hypothetical protein
MFFGCERDKTIKYKYKSDDITEVERREIEEMKIRLIPMYGYSFMMIFGGAAVGVLGREINVATMLFFGEFVALLGCFLLNGTVILNELIVDD